MDTIKSTSATAGWRMYHSALGATKNLILNETGGALTQTAVFNDTAPTSSVFTIGNAADINTSGANYLAYCFAEKKDLVNLDFITEIIQHGAHL